MAWKRKVLRRLPYKRHHMLKNVGLWLLFCMAQRHTNFWAANSRANLLLELRWKSCIAYNVHGANSITTNWYCWTKNVSQISVKLISNNCFPDSHVWFGFTATDAKIPAQIGCGTTTDPGVYCRLGSHTWWTLGHHNAENEPKNGAHCGFTPIAVVEQKQ